MLILPSFVGEVKSVGYLVVLRAEYQSSLWILQIASVYTAMVGASAGEIAC